MRFFKLSCLAVCFMVFANTEVVLAQIPPSRSEIEQYQGLLAAAAKGDVVGIAIALATGADPNVQDQVGRAPLHVAAYQWQYETVRALLAARTNPNALENQRYDIVTIAAVANDLDLLKIALDGGCSPKNITGPYHGTALISAAHLGHVNFVRELIKAGAPIDHVNDLGWTALIEAVILGDGGNNHQETVKALVSAEAKVNIADRAGQTPLMVAKRKKYKEIVAILETAGAK